MTRECWVVEEQDRETGEWFPTDVCFTEAQAREVLRKWRSAYPHRVVRYAPQDDRREVSDAATDEAMREARGQ